MFITSFSAGIVLILFGTLVWKFKFIALIAGRRGRETDKEGLAKWIGKNMIIMGMVVWVSALIQILIFKDTRQLIDFAIILVLSTRMAIGAGKFSKPIAKPSKKSMAKAKKRPKN